MKAWLASVDNALVKLGRLVLLKPILSMLLMLTAVGLTFSYDWHAENTKSPVVRISIPITLKPLEAFTHTAANFYKAPSQSTTNSASVETPKVSPPTPPSSIIQTVSPALSATPPKIDHWQMFMLHPGDTLVKIFKRYHVNMADYSALIAMDSAQSLRHLTPGKTIRISVDSQGHLQQLVYYDTKGHTTAFTRSTHGFEVAEPPLTQETQPLSSTANASSSTQNIPNSLNVTDQSPSTVSASHYLQGQIHHNLKDDARHLGLSAQQTTQLVQLFADQPVSVGDTWQVLLDSPRKNILAATLTHQQETIQWIRFTDPKGHVDYYSPEGLSNHPSILRAPLSYTRISSYFSKNRFQPILHFFRPHLGVDYAAPVGTPIKAAGDGVITQMTRMGGYGNEIVIRHDATYSTLYAHLQSYAGGVRTGDVVHQGQVIGYVGSSGLATGPHLHYEIRVNHVAMNPLTVTLPGAPLPLAYRPLFLAQSHTILAVLKTAGQHSVVPLSHLAANNKRSTAL